MAFDFAGELRKARAAAQLRNTCKRKPPTLSDNFYPTTKENIHSPDKENQRTTAGCNAVVSGGEARQNGDLSWPEAEAASVLLRSVVWDPPDDARWHIPNTAVQKLCYLPDVLTVEEEQSLLNATYASPASTW